MPETRQEVQADNSEGQRIRTYYSYMDHMDFDGYIWEMIRRTRDYRDLIDACQSEANALDNLDETFFARWDNEFHNLGIEVTFDNNTRQASYYIVGEIDTTHIALPYNIPHHEFGSVPPMIVGTRLVKCIGDMRPFLRTFLNEDKQFGSDGIAAFLGALSPIRSDQTICIGVNRIGDKQVIKRQLNKVISKLVKKPHKRKVIKKWKYYIIVHDLLNGRRSNQRTIERIANILQEAYPEHRSTFDATNIRYYITQARSLIDHAGYKEYIFR